MKKIPDGSVDFILADPPYGTTACKWDSTIPFEPMWKQLNRICKNGSTAALFGGEPFASALRMSNVKFFKYDWCWVKSKSTNFLNAGKQPLRKYETVSIFCNGKTMFNEQKIMGEPYYRGYRADKYRSKSRDSSTGTYSPYESKSDTGERHAINVLYYNTAECEGKVVHPTQKPVALLEYLIRTYTNEGDTVLDFTMGSGSTGVACANTNRKFIGIELDDNYYSIAYNRIKEAQHIVV